jgi:hypothetical protein
MDEVSDDAREALKYVIFLLRSDIPLDRSDRDLVIEALLSLDANGQNFFDGVEPIFEGTR